MAWVTLHDLLDPKKNFYGIIPASAACKFSLGLDHEYGDYISAVPHMKEEWVKKLRPLIEQVSCIQDFIDKDPAGLSREIEWSLNDGGSLSHWDGLYQVEKRGPLKWMIFCELDIRPWLRKNPEAVEKIVGIMGYDPVKDRGLWKQNRIDAFRRAIAEKG